MRAEFYRQDDPASVVGKARWTGRGVDVEAGAEEVRSALRRVFRPVPVAVDDPAWRTAGTSGPTTLQPGGLLWFMAAARSGSEAEGLRVRLVPEGGGAMGWDPAASYRTFTETVVRKERTGTEQANHRSGA